METGFQIPGAVITAPNNRVSQLHLDLDRFEQSQSFNEVNRYLKKLGEVRNITQMTVDSYLTDFLVAQDVTSNAIAQSIYFESKAKALLDEMRSIAFFERAENYLKSKGLKISAEARKQYIDIDPDVVAAKDVYARSLATAELFKNRLWAFKYAHADAAQIKKQGMTAYEGM